jgi:uncharacterized protein (UPF0335 family)
MQGGVKYYHRKNRFTSIEVMMQSNEPNDRNQETERQLRNLSRRVDRLEYSQISPQEFSRSFDRVYDEIDALENIVNERLDRVDARFDLLEREVREINRKFDIVMQYITGQGGTSQSSLKLLHQPSRRC